jgi:hypothetical protein
VAVLVADSANPYNMMPVRDRVVEETGKDAMGAVTRWRKSTFVLTSTSVSQAGRKADILLKIKPENVFYRKPR